MLLLCDTALCISWEWKHGPLSQGAALPCARILLYNWYRKTDEFFYSQRVQRRTVPLRLIGLSFRLLEAVSSNCSQLCIKPPMAEIGSSEPSNNLMRTNRRLR